VDRVRQQVGPQALDALFDRIFNLIEGRRRMLASPLLDLYEHRLRMNSPDGPINRFAHLHIPFGGIGMRSGSPEPPGHTRCGDAHHCKILADTQSSTKTRCVRLHGDIALIWPLQDRIQR